MLCMTGLSSLMSSTFAQKRFNEEEELQDPKLAMNRATSTSSITERVAVRSKQAPLLDTFRGTTSKVVGDGIWKERGLATVWYDTEGQIISVEVENNEAAFLEDVFGKMCEEQALYQLQLVDFDLITTQNACTYKDRGLNETLTFFTDDQAKNLISFSYNVSATTFHSTPLAERLIV